MRSPSGELAKVQDFGLEVKEFEFQSRCYVQFRTNTLGKSINPNPSGCALNSLTSVFLQEWL